MNSSLSTFMKIAATSAVIVALLWNKLMGVMADIANDIVDILTKM